MEWLFEEEQAQVMQLYLSYLSKHHEFDREDLADHLESCGAIKTADSKAISSIWNGGRKKAHKPTYDYIKKFSDSRIRDISPWGRSMYRRIYGVESHPLAIVSSGLETMFAEASGFNEAKLKQFSDNYQGVYVFARYAVQWARQRKKSILCGALQIHPVQKGENFLRATNYIQNRALATRAPGSDNHNTLESFIFPFQKYFYEVGMDMDNQYPFFVASSVFSRRVDSFPGMSFRRYPNGRLIAARVVHKRTKYKSIEDAKDEMKYITIEEFENNFDFKAKDMLNIGRHDGEGVLVSLD